MTFISDTFHDNKLHDTFPISIGLKSGCHNVVEPNFIDKINELSSGMNNLCYCAMKKKNVYVQFEIIASPRDQPKRREMHYFMGGNSRFCARYLFSANISFMVDVLPPCKECMINFKNKPQML